MGFYPNAILHIQTAKWYQFNKYQYATILNIKINIKIITVLSINFTWIFSNKAYLS